LVQADGGDRRLVFEPRSVAVVDALRDPVRFGHVQLRKFIELGFQGEVYAVNPNADQVLASSPAGPFVKLRHPSTQRSS